MPHAFFFHAACGKPGRQTVGLAGASSRWSAGHPSPGSVIRACGRARGRPSRSRPCPTQPSPGVPGWPLPWRCPGCACSAGCSRPAAEGATRWPSTHVHGRTSRPTSPYKSCYSETSIIRTLLVRTRTRVPSKYCVIQWVKAPGNLNARKCKTVKTKGTTAHFLCSLKACYVVRAHQSRVK